MNTISGWLDKRKTSKLSSLLGNWNKRYFRFDGIYLSYYQNENNIYNPSKKIHISDINYLEPETISPSFIFYVVTKERNYTLKATTESE